MAETLADHSQEFQRVFRALEADESRRPRARIGKQPKRSGGDDAERALGADEEPLHIVAGIVLPQLAQAVDDPSVGKHGLDSGHEVARIAVGDHGHAAGVGRDIAAYGARSLRRQRQRKQPVGGERGGLGLGEGDAGLADHHVAVEVDLADPAQALGREDDLLAARVRRLSADEPGVAALRRHADPRLVAERRDGGDFLRRARPHERERTPMIEAARLDERAREQRRIGQHMAGPDDLLQGGKNGVAFHRAYSIGVRTHNE